MKYKEDESTIIVYQSIYSVPALNNQHVCMEMTKGLVLSTVGKSNTIDEYISNLSNEYDFLCRSGIHNVANELKKGGRVDISSISMKGFILANDNDDSVLYEMKASSTKADLKDDTCNMFSFHSDSCSFNIRCDEVIWSRCKSVLKTF